MEQIDITPFVSAVDEMRAAQKHYWELPSPYRLKLAMGKEARVDEWLKRLRSAGIILPPSTTQSNLFNS